MKFSPIVTVSLLICLSLLQGCTNTKREASEDGGNDYGVEKLYTESDRAVWEFEKKGLLLNAPELTEYINRLGNEMMAGVADRPNIEFHILRDSMVNAFAFPNGHVYVTVGLLARLENEAQLAFILAHEAAHIIHKHSEERLHERRSTVVTAHIADLVLMGTSIAYVPFAMSIASYSREQESHADSEGMSYLLSSDYAPEKAISVFDIMQEVKSEEAIEGSIYASHPSNAYRRKKLKELVGSNAGKEAEKGKVDSDNYSKILTKVIHENLSLKLRDKHFELTVDAANKAMKKNGSDPWLYYYRAESKRSSALDPKAAAKEYSWLYGKDNDDELVEKFAMRRTEYIEEAKQDYVKCLEIDPSFTLAYRGLGLIAYEKGDAKVARENLSQYLTRGEGIRDARYIKSILQEVSDDE